MASAKLIAKRYAKALRQLLPQTAEADKALATLTELRRLIETNADLRQLVQNSVFTVEQRWSVLEPLCQKLGASPELTRFLAFLTKGGRASVLAEVESEYRHLVLESENAVEATVESALPLSAAQEKQLRTTLETYTGKRVELRSRVSPEIVAGLRIHVMGKTLDASLAANLERMKKQLLNQAEA